jgi:hypothetical protein
MSAVARRRDQPLAGAAPLPARKKWRAITLATLVFAPAYWAIVAGRVALAVEGGPSNAGSLVAFGVCLIPFVYIVLAFSSEHPRAPRAVVRAMGLSLLVGIPVSAVVRDAVTGLIAGMGAGGVAALRADLVHGWRTRAWAVVAVSLYTLLLALFAPAAALLFGPALPLASLGLADHVSERRAERAASEG